MLIIARKPDAGLKKGVVKKPFLNFVADPTELFSLDKTSLRI
jgi:hypothetical protein